MDSVRFAVVGDLHVGAVAEEVQTAIDLVNTQPLDFVLFLGDLVHEATDENIEEFVRQAGRIDKPVYLTLGNHDVGRAEEGFDFEDKIGRAWPGPWSDSFTYAFQAGEWSFVVGGLASGTLPFAGVQVNHHKGFVSETGGYLYMQGRHLERFGELLEATGDRPTCAVTHVPLVRMAERVHARGCYDQVHLLEEIQILSLLEARANVKMALSGHQHFNQVDVVRGRLHCVTQGVRGYGPYGDPSAIRIVELSAGRVHSHLFWPGLPPQPPAPISTLAGDCRFQWQFG